jgi:undecaprenyl-diphosphatase
MDLLHATILGIVEGLTEFVPVSSTGHLILAGHWLGLGQGADKAAIDAFDIVIQAGAWLACLLYYAPLLMKRLRELRSPEPVPRLRARNLLIALAVSFLPVMIVGLLLRKKIKALLFGPAPVAAALLIGGIVMIVADRMLARRNKKDLDAIDVPTAAGIGLVQCFALIPGTSRSMATIVGGLFLGLEVQAAADFSFLLAIPVLGAATLYELLKSWHELITYVGPVAMTVGLIASFLTGWASIAGFLRFIAMFGLVPFGIYRIGLAAVVWLTLLRT